MAQSAIRRRGHGRCRWLSGLAWIYLLLCAGAPVFALEIQEVRWGFDGRVVPSRFNLLSVLVANPSGTPFEGTVNFYKVRGLEERVGAIYETPCYLSPLGSRWLQFYVYIDNQYDQWRLQWGSLPEDSQELQPPKWGPPAQVLLSDSENTMDVNNAFKQFPDELFPPTAAATSGLDSLLLDHAPRWVPAKKQALLNWIRTGGKLHLLLGTDGRYPTFSDELATLNSPAERQRIGAGLVIRHALTTRDLRQEDVREGGVPFREFKPNESGTKTQTADSFLAWLARFSQRRYDWGLIYLLAVTYVLVAGPGNLLAGRKLTDYRLRIVLLLLTIGGFALLFNAVGRRGQGEAGVIHSLSYAQAIDGDTYEVTQWINVFEARGSHYVIAHTGTDNLYATGQDYESVNGWIESGKDGRFIVDIPMFSRRAFLHQAEMKGANIPVKIVRWEGAEQLQQLVVTVGPDFSKQVLEGWAVQGRQIYSMRFTKDGLEFGDMGWQSLETFISTSTLQQFEFNQRPPSANVITNAGEQFRSLVKPLIAWSLDLKDFTQPGVSSPASNDHVQLYLFARSPQSFCIAGSGLGQEIGYVLYHLDLFKPGKAG